VRAKPSCQPPLHYVYAALLTAAPQSAPPLPVGDASTTGLVGCGNSWRT
jgi:hypothetical protein